ncbi:MAG: right-handed parallel beta-helix repeat-containing protein [Lentisphaerae bacterium]|nr:right-handed parallel beta-helix repeat-containing protein [Lentisphaerota bacterium]
MRRTPHRHGRRLLSAGFWLAPAAALATGYWVDFTDGDDARDGLTPATALQRCPGDAAATGVAAATRLQPGDMVRFKGGVVYHGSISVTASGTADQPITFDGNSDGTWGLRRAIIDGGEAVTGWRRCASAAAAGGNPRWAELFTVDLPKPARGNTLALCDATNALPTAQHPNPRDPFWQEDTSHFLVAPRQLESLGASGMRFSDPVNLKESDTNYYLGMTFAFHGGNNRICYLPVTGYDPATGTLSLPPFQDRQYGQTRYCLLNAVRLIDQPGEYSVEAADDPASVRAFLFPPRLLHGQPADIAASVRPRGFALNGASHVTVRGFLLRRQGGDALSASGPAAGIVFRHCEITLVRGTAVSAHRINGIRVEDCHIHDNPAHSKGIVLRACQDAVTLGCRLVRNTSTAIDYYACTNGQVIGNIVREHHGSHANGLTFYLGCRNMLVASNDVADSNVALTFQAGEKFVFRDNVFDGSLRSMVVGIWPSQPLKDVRFDHNTIVRGKPDSAWEIGLFSNSRRLEGLVVEHNIIDGLCSDHNVFRSGTFRSNLYTRIGKDQAGGLLGEAGRVEPNLAALFVAPDVGDFRPRAEGPAVGFGARLKRLEYTP